jgi:hypothetical protein
VSIPAVQQVNSGGAEHARAARSEARVLHQIKLHLDEHILLSTLISAVGNARTANGAGSQNRRIRVPCSASRVVLDLDAYRIQFSFAGVV